MENKKIYFIDVVYFNAYCFYRRYEKDLNEFSGQALTAVCLSLNAIMLLLLIQEKFKIILFENKWLTLLASVPILIVVVIRYNKYITIHEIEEVLNNKTKTKFTKLNLLAFTYIILSIFGTITFAIILGELNNPPPFWENWFN